MNYRFDGKQKTLALGVYPTVTLADARQRREDARRMLANGTDPGEARKAAKVARTAAAAIAADTFEAVAREWLKKREASGETSAATISKDRWRLEGYLFPAIGSRPISEITARELRDALRPIEDSGDVPPPLSSTPVWSPIPHPKEIGREEALFRRADHRLPA
jgi:hypothetical protein